MDGTTKDSTTAFTANKLESLSAATVLPFLKKYEDYNHAYVPQAGVTKAKMANGLTADALMYMYDCLFARKSAAWSAEDAALEEHLRRDAAIPLS